MSDAIERLNSALEGRYVIRKPIGQGASATVYLADDVKHDRQVALKVLRPELSAALGTDRFLQEIKITARLSHPNILPLLDSGEADGLLFYAMPFVEGESLRARLNRDKQLRADEAVTLVREVASALDYAHGQDIVHRDIKPENLLIQHGHAVVTDFGIARAISAAGGNRMTEMGHAVGTPAYMSPEQVTGGDELDARSDVYALGCLCYEMLTGKPPFGGATVESIIGKQLVAEAPSVAESRQDIPPEITDAVKRALQKDPARRFASAGEFRDALGAAITGSGQFSVVAARLVHRRVPQVLLLYAGLAIVVVALLHFLVDRFVLSPHLPTFGLVALASLLPTVLIVTYKRNTPGWSPLEKVGVPLNIAAAAALLFVMFGTKDLGAATREVTLTNEEGERVTRVIPKAEFRRRLALFPFDNRSGDSTLDWISNAISIAMQVDLEQDLFLSVRTTPYFIQRLEQVGYPDGLGMPFPLRQQIADEQRLPFIVSGEFMREGDSLSVTMRLHQTENGKLVKERTIRGPDPLSVVDVLTLDLKRALGLPAQHIQEVQDQPVAGFFTDSTAALRAHILGLEAVQRRDWARAATLLEQAVSTDPTYGLVYNALYVVYLVTGQSAKGIEALEAAMRHIYRFPERLQYALKGEYYHIAKQDFEKAIAAHRMRVELVPDDIQGHAALGLIYTVNAKRDSAIAEYERILEIDPSQYEVLKQLGELHESQGEFEQALDYYDRYARAFPDDAGALGTLAGLQRELGNHEGAGQTYERALLIEPDDPETLVGLGAVATDLGEFARAEELFREALDAARTPAESAEVLGGLAGYYGYRGRMTEAIARLEELFTASERSQPPLFAALVRIRAADEYVRAGRASSARQMLREIESRLGAPWNLLAQLGYIESYLELEQPDSANAAIERFVPFIEQMGFENLRTPVMWARGRVQQQMENCTQALETYAKVLAADPTRSQAHTHVGACHRELGQLDEAEKSLRRRLNVRPLDPWAHYELALVFADRGDRTRAIEHLESALETWDGADPGFEPAQRARARLDEIRTGGLELTPG